MNQNILGSYLKKIVFNPFFLVSLLLIIAVLCLFGSVLFSPSQSILLSDRDGDLSNQFYSWREFGFSELRKGHIALWNPYVFCGAPYLAGFQSALFYPPNWFFLFFPLVFALNFSIALHFILGGIFMCLWLAKYKLHWGACFFGSFTFVFGGAYYLHLYPGHLSNLCTMVWIPLVFLVMDCLAERISSRWVLGGIAILSMQLLAGHVQYFFFTAFAALIYIGLKPRTDSLSIGKQLFAFSIIYTGALLICAIQWIPALQAVGESLRSLPLSNQTQKDFSLEPLNLLTLFMPGLSADSPPLFCWGKNSIWWEKSVFIGSTASFLSLYALLKNPEPRLRRILLFILVMITLALGSYTPLLPFLYKVIPFFNFFRGSYKFNIFIHLGFCFLCSFGMDLWLRENKYNRWLPLGTLGFAFLFLFAALEGFQISGVRILDELLQLSASNIFINQNNLNLPSQIFKLRSENLGMLSLNLFFFSGALWLSRFHRSFRYSLLLLGLAELMFFNYKNLPTFSELELQKDFSSVHHELDTRLGDGRIYWLSRGDRALHLRMPDIMGSDPMILKRFGYFIAYSQKLSIDQFYPFIPALFYFPPSFKLLRLQYLISDMKGELKVIPIPNPLFPRALLLGKWRQAVGNEMLLSDLNDPNFQPNQEVLLENQPNPLPLKNPKLGRITIQDLNSDLMEIRVLTDQPQILLITDNYSSGWKTEAFPDSDQKIYSIMPGDYLYRAIPLSAGRHHFYLKYDPSSFFLGRWISILSLLSYMAFVCAKIRLHGKVTAF